MSCDHYSSILLIEAYLLTIIKLIFSVGRGRWLRVLREETPGDLILRAKLLWRVRQRWSHDECRRNFVMLLPGAY